MARLEGKVALITGAARGQGRAHALTLAREGAEIVALDISDDIESVPYELAGANDLEQTIAGVEDQDRRGVAIQADVRSQEQLDQAVERGISEFGKIDILVANAGISSVAPFWEIGEQMWQDMIDINLNGVWRSAKAVAPHMIERRQGALRCNAVCPGAIDTPMINNPLMHELFAGQKDPTREAVLESVRHYNMLNDRTLLPPEVRGQQRDPVAGFRRGRARNRRRPAGRRRAHDPARLQPVPDAVGERWL